MSDVTFLLQRIGASGEKVPEQVLTVVYREEMASPRNFSSHGEPLVRRARARSYQAMRS